MCKSGEGRWKELQLTLGDLAFCPHESGLTDRQRPARRREKSAEAIVPARAGKGRILGIKESVLGVSRSTESQNLTGGQMELFDSNLRPVVCGAGGVGVSDAAALAERQVLPASSEQRALAQGLMERVASLAYLD